MRFQAIFFPFKEQSCYTALLKIYTVIGRIFGILSTNKRYDEIQLSLWGCLGLGKSLGLKLKKLIYLSTLLQEVQGYHQLYHQHLEPVVVDVDQEVVELHGGVEAHIY